LICNQYVGSQGKLVGFRQPTFSVRELLEACKDAYLNGHVEDFENAITKVASAPL
jgi:hypothetical protein